nr:C-factor-like [Misgurnus anguillicaudatus]XP_055042323.1 C-factor-like [Misgurnus anguillicaudatus]
MMAAVKAASVLITGANRGLGLEMVKQILEAPCPKRQIFAGCRDPHGPKSEALRELAKQHPNMLTITHLDVTDLSSIKEAANKVSSSLGTRGLNLLVNNAALCSRGTLMTVKAERMRDMFNTNVIGTLSVIREFLPYLQTAARASDISGMSCDKAAVINISSIGGSVSSMPGIYHQFPLLPYCVSKAGLNMLTALAAHELKADEILCMAIHPGWVKTDMGGEKAVIETRDSVAGLLKVMSNSTENEHGGFMDYTGQTMPW